MAFRKAGKNSEVAFRKAGSEVAFRKAGKNSEVAFRKARKRSGFYKSSFCTLGRIGLGA